MVNRFSELDIFSYALLLSIILILSFQQIVQATSIIRCDERITNLSDYEKLISSNILYSKNIELKSILVSDCINEGILSFSASFIVIKEFSTYSIQYDYEVSSAAYKDGTIINQTIFQDDDLIKRIILNSESNPKVKEFIEKFGISIVTISYNTVKYISNDITVKIPIYTTPYTTRGTLTFDAVKNDVVQYEFPQTTDFINYAELKELRELTNNNLNEACSNQKPLYNFELYLTIDFPLENTTQKSYIGKILYENRNVDIKCPGRVLIEKENNIVKELRFDFGEGFYPPSESSKIYQTLIAFTLVISLSIIILYPIIKERFAHK